MKNYLALGAFLCSIVTTSFATSFSNPMDTGKRTDGPAGSEYSDFDSIDGRFSFGAQFGALLPTAKAGSSSFALGLDADFRPYDLFGARLTYFQGTESPKNAVISITPLIHGEVSNVRPYAAFGPGIGITTLRGGTKLRFALAAGIGADVEIVRGFSIGLAWNYHALIASYDLHSLAARFAWTF